MKMLLFVGVIFFLGFIGFAYMHEQVHVEIFRSYGIDSHVDYFSNFPNFVTIAQDNCPTEECTLAHNINESISYPLVIIYIVFGLIILSILGMVESLVDIKMYELNKRKRN